MPHAWGPATAKKMAALLACCNPPQPHHASISAPVGRPQLTWKGCTLMGIATLMGCRSILVCAFRRQQAPGTSQALLCCQVAWVRRRAAAKGALPRSHLQADFDIVAPSGQALADLLLAEAECIRAVLEALAKVKGVEVSCASSEA